MEQKLTKYKSICFLCGKPAECEHHLIFGLGLRDLADEDGLKAPICNKCHTLGRGTECIHGNIAAERLSKIAGQLLYEATTGTREEFRKRYGQSYL